MISIENGVLGYITPYAIKRSVRLSYGWIVGMTHQDEGIYTHDYKLPFVDGSMSDILGSNSAAMRNARPNALKMVSAI